MKTLAILSQKGGAGKTTIALHLAVTAEQAGVSTAIVDLDPQASATGWKDSRSDETPAVVSTQAVRLPHVLDAARKAGAQLVILDTAPHSENSALAAARMADLILIPCRPAILDIRAITTTIDLARLAGKPACVVLNSIPSRGQLADEASLAISQMGVSVCPVRLGQRASYAHALTAGQSVQEYEPTGKATEEIKQLYMWICKQINM